MKGKTDLETSNNPWSLVSYLHESPKQKKRRICRVKTGRFYLDFTISQVLGFVNPVVDSDDENDDTFKPERRFPDVFNTCVN